MDKFKPHTNFYKVQRRRGNKAAFIVCKGIMYFDESYASKIHFIFYNIQMDMIVSATVENDVTENLKRHYKYVSDKGYSLDEILSQYPLLNKHLM